GEPGAPAALDAHAREHLRHAEHDAPDRKREENRREVEDDSSIPFLDRIEDRAIPEIDAVLEADSGDNQHGETDRKWPRQPVALAAPKASGADPEARQQIILARLLDLFRGQLCIRVKHFRRWRDDFLAVLAALFAFFGRLLDRRTTRAKSNGSPSVPA